MVFKNSAALTYACLLLAALAVCHATSQGLWSSGSLSSARYSLAAASLRDQVIFAGGSLASSETCRVDRYSASTDSWTQECLSVARSWLSAASISLPAPSTAEFALFAGGLSDSTASNRIDVFNSQTSSWSVSPVNLSVARFAMAAASLDSLSLVFFAGGRGREQVWGIVDALKISPSGSIEASVLDMSVPRHALCATSLPLQSVVIFAGGFTSAGSSSSVVDIYDASSQKWTVSSLSVSRSYLAATTLVSRSLAFFAGGWTGTQSFGSCSKVVDIYNGATKTWTQATLSVARHHLAAGALELQGIVVFAGGLKAATQSFTGQYSNDIDIYVAPSNSWTIRTLVTARSLLVPAVLPLRGLLYLGGGFTGSLSNEVDVWDVRTDSLGPSMPTITLSNSVRGSKGISMTISMVPANPVPANGKIVITLPGSFNCSAGTPVFFSPRGNPERSGAASIGGSILTISILTGTLYGGNPFSMTFAGVTNPSAPQAFSSAVNAATLNENGLMIGSSFVGSLVAVVPNLGPSSPSISLSSNVARRKNVTMTVTLVPEFPIPVPFGTLRITLSGMGWELQDHALVEFSTPHCVIPCLASVSGTSVDVYGSEMENGSSKAFVFSLQFSSGQFLAYEMISFKIFGVRNPFPASDGNLTASSVRCAVTDRVEGSNTNVIVGASVSSLKGVFIIDEFVCDLNMYFSYATSSCQACEFGYVAPRGSVSATACLAKWLLDLYNFVGAIIGVALFVNLIHFYYCITNFKQQWIGFLEWLKSLSKKVELLAIASSAIATGLPCVASCDIDINKHVKKKRGGSATVYQATWNGNPNFAVKKPHFVGAMTERDEAKFVKELSNHAQLRHPNCVHVYAVCLEKNNVFIVMEWMHGGSLWERLQHTRQDLLASNSCSALSLSSRKRLEIARQICDGLQYMHSKGMVHGDIKSLNVLLGKDGNAKLCDFGLTTMGLTTATNTGALCTPHWCAPEILCQGLSHTPQTDIYALGIVMWELLTCAPPYEGLTFHQIYGQLKSHQRPLIPNHIHSCFPAAYVTMMTRCWDQDPLKRPSAAEVHQFLIDHDPSAQPNAPVELFPSDHRLLANVSMLSCLTHALPEACCATVLQAVVSEAEKSTLTASVQLMMATHSLSACEAQSIFVYTASQNFAVCPVHGAPFSLYNTALRSARPVSVSAWRDYSFLLYNALLKLPSVSCTVYRGLNIPLSEMSHLYWKGGFVWLQSPTSTTIDKDKTMRQFGQGGGSCAGTFMELRVKNAKEIECFSAVPGERERLIPQNTCFRVLNALSAADVRMLNGFGTLPPDVDLVVVEEVVKGSAVYKNALQYRRKMKKA